MPALGLVWLRPPAPCPAVILRRSFMLQFPIRRGGGGRSTILPASKGQSPALKAVGSGMLRTEHRGFASSQAPLLQTSPQTLFLSLFGDLKCTEYSLALRVLPLLSLGLEKCYFYIGFPNLHRILSSLAWMSRLSPGDQCQDHPCTSHCSSGWRSFNAKAESAGSHPASRNIHGDAPAPPANPKPLSTGLSGLPQPGVRIQGCRQPQRRVSR